jgi:hypothetical protein
MFSTIHRRVAVGFDAYREMARVMRLGWRLSSPAPAIHSAAALGTL